MESEIRHPMEPWVLMRTPLDTTAHVHISANCQGCEVRRRACAKATSRTSATGVRSDATLLFHWLVLRGGGRSLGELHA
jgi:hypothetical protein